MVKKIASLAAVGLVALPAFAVAADGRSQADLERKIEALERQLEELKAQVGRQNETITQYGDKVDSMDTMLEEKSEKWDLASRFQFDGDFRARGDYYKADNLFAAGGDQENDTILTNRLRLNMRVKATEDVEFKGRLAMYKAWGMESTPDGLGGGFPIFDGNTTRTPDDSALYVDRAFINWNNIGGAPVWFSIGRRPTSDGPPAQLRMNYEERMATPVAYMDYPFDGLSLGYGYDWDNDALGEGRIRFCYGRGFESGLQSDTDPLWNNDTDFAGFSWDVFKQGPRFLNVQVFGAFNLFNYPAFSSDFVNYGAAFPPDEGGYGVRKNVGNIYHTSAVYMDKHKDLNYFVAGGWSRTDPNDNGMFNDPFSGTNNTGSENGYSFYTGIRYDMDNIGLRIGAEYNYGSQYWVSFSPGHDDIYMSKLATRGSAYELYLIYDLPTGEAISKFAKTFIRLGWQYYDYDYSGYFDWNMKPYDLGSEQAQLQMLGQNPVESANQVYLTFEAYF
ncbi:DUF3373 family protein [Desulfobulbus elongatus]|uniref:DUF3373 family protein n=1 Tax=Desulfobulbus elongatus TaxID=53332 RepID=UPI000486777B|nr:DUF3373 family protein [Desulfobulbus elongatus]